MNFRCEAPVLNCDDCGACCQHIVMPPFAADIYGDAPNPEWTALIRDHPALAAELQAEHLRKDRENELHRQAPCFWYDAKSKRCKHHDARPQICRDFAVGGEDCLAARRGGRFVLVLPGDPDCLEAKR